ncbi:hypothetical protein [Bordetella bronchialis]|uniref:Leucine-rich repeat domain-containing protein n=1 Tax=Bordetella bronchialis TaxID=463025 RepID=A0A193FW87_9BORD|nr:hypothetical protein [Bordetella bronchialis]ANN72027.1 hypothetical protein BAU08_12410 [Bordetella bronchialis]
MIVISPMVRTIPTSLEIPTIPVDAYVKRDVLAEATVGLERAAAPQGPLTLTTGVKLDPRVVQALDAWVARAGTGEDRATARSRIVETMAHDARKARLSLKGLGLREVPPVIPDVYSLDVSDNRIVDLPPLPCDIQYLLAANNRIAELKYPLPGDLVVADLSHNRLTELPETLPGRMVRLDVQNNALKTLPRNMSRELRILNVDENAADLSKAAADCLSSRRVLRVFDVSLGGPGLSATRAARKLDTLRCTANRDHHLAAIPLVRA